MNQHTTIIDTAPSWYAVRTKPGQEYLAEAELGRIGTEAYLPQYRKEYRHHRSKRWIVRCFPLFKGYILIPGPVDDWGILNDCDGLARDGLLRDTNDKPVRIPGDVVRDIRDDVEKGSFDDLKTHGHRLQVGQAVKITEGPFTGAEGIIASPVKSIRSARVLINLFNTQVVVRAPVAKIDKVG